METKETDAPPLFDDRPWAKDALHVTMTVSFDWRDRLNILLTGVFELRTTTYCENLLGLTETDDVRTSTSGLFTKWRMWRNRNKRCFGEAVVPEALFGIGEDELERGYGMKNFWIFAAITVATALVLYSWFITSAEKDWGGK